MKRLVLIIILLPSISFWSTAIGKDGIAFMATGFALWSSLNLGNRKGLMVFAMLFVRPHMAGILVLAVSISILFDKSVNIKIKMLIFVGSVLVTSVMVPYALKYAGVGNDVSVEVLQMYIEGRQGHNTQGGSSVNIASMSLPEQMFTYIFRPLPFEARSLTTFLASIDNTLLFVLFCLGIKHVWRMSSDGSNRTFMWAYATGALIILSMTTANLGIAMRQKWMFMPMFIYLFVSAIAQSRRRD